ncbi:MAG: outer membrane beta-barrel protein [Myxococcales bacterium]|nr:outer membrane beta-barrel protein [Myxococcales bacterium]
MRLSIVLLAAGTCLLAPSLAFAQDDADCPPGGWFCEETEPPPDATPPGEEPDVEEPAKPPPDVTVHEQEDGSRKIIIVDKPENKPKKPRRRAKREWGFNLHLEGVLMGSKKERNPDAGMGGLGFSLRYRPVPSFALDAGFDFLGGKDYLGYERSESALLLNGIVFFNPKDKAQIYAIGGLGFSGAEVTKPDPTNPDTTYQERYSYFGGQLGMGLEFRIAKRTALNFDVIGFIRGRTDEKAQLEPEFVDPDTGRTTNTSGGGLFRGGITFYW